MTIRQLEKVGMKAIEVLRENKLRTGLPFMINTKDLPSSQFYLEYSDGSIKLATIREDKLDFKIIAELTMEESDGIRKKYKLSNFTE